MKQFNKTTKTVFNSLMFAVLAITSNSIQAKTHHHTDQDAHKITICHYPPGNPGNPQTISISKSAWESHRELHGDVPGECGILAGEGCFAESFTVYGMNDDFDGIAVYQLDTEEVIGLSPSIEFPDEIENLTASQGKTYYGIQSFNHGDNVYLDGDEVDFAWLYEITLEQNVNGSYTGSYKQVSTIKSADYGSNRYPEFDALELIDGEFYTADNEEEIWVKFSLDGTILAYKDFRSDLPNRSKQMQDMAYDPDKKILYATHVWSNNSYDKTHLIALDLTNGFENMVEVDKGIIHWRKIEGLLFKNGTLYGASDKDNKLFKIIQDEDGNVIGEEDVPGWDSSMSSDIEGIANTFVTEDCPVVTPPPPPPTAAPHDFGKFGRFNVKEAK